MNKLSSEKSIIILIIGLILLIFAIFSINYFMPTILHDYQDISPTQSQYQIDQIDQIEQFRGGRHRRNRRNKLRPSRRRWWGNDWGYRYRPPPPPSIYNYSWYNPWHWFSPICKRGCTQTSIGEWGCQYPGYSPNDCMFATDCRGC